MSVDITIPSPGESITEVTIGAWHKNTGEWVEKDEILLEIESDKATLEVPSPESGLLQTVGSPGEEMAVGAVVAVQSALTTSSLELSTTLPPPCRSSCGATRSWVRLGSTSSDV